MMTWSFLLFFFYLMFLPVLRYCRLSDLKRCILSALLLLKYSRYKPEIFSDRRLKTEIVHEGWKSYILPKASGLEEPENVIKKSTWFFVVVVVYLFCRNFFWRHIIQKKNYIYNSCDLKSSWMGLTPQIKGLQGSKVFI